ncbi:metallophosphoesterase [bacterium]|nr:metallophosphoesterase [bacterium]
MKIGIMSDSHDHLDNIKKAVELFKREGVEYVVHCGDFVAPFTLPILSQLGVPFLGVFGNNDGERLLLRERAREFGEIKVQPAFLELAGKKLVVMHEPTLQTPLARSGEFDVVLVGHTHKAEIIEDKCLIINPGETCGWLTGKATVAILDLETLIARLIEL